MTMHEIRDGDALTLALEGRLDTLSSPVLEDFLDKNIPALSKLVFDFEKLEYISSAGLRTVLKAERAMKDRGGVLILHASRLVKEVFRITGFDTILHFED